MDINTENELNVLFDKMVQGLDCETLDDILQILYDEDDHETVVDCLRFSLKTRMKCMRAEEKGRVWGLIWKLKKTLS